MVGKKEDVSVGLVILTIILAVAISFVVSLATINLSKPVTLKDASLDSGAIVVSVGEKASSGGIIKVEVGEE